MTKPVFASSVLLSDFIRAEAAVPEAVVEQRLAAVYTAAYHVIKSGNKTQWNTIAAACTQYANTKACKEALGVTSVNAAVKRMHTVYLAYGAALTACGVPSLMKGATHEQMDDAAAMYATEFASLVTVALTPEVKAVKTAEEKAAAKALKEKEQAAAQAQAEAEQQAAIDAKVADIAAASALTMADMVQAVVNAIRMGMATPDQLETLNAALDDVAANVVLVNVQADAPATMANA